VGVHRSGNEQEHPFERSDSRYHPSIISREREVPTATLSFYPLHYQMEELEHIRRDVQRKELRELAGATGLEPCGLLVQAGVLTKLKTPPLLTMEILSGSLHALWFLPYHLRAVTGQHDV